MSGNVERLEVIEDGPVDADACIVMLHGLGADGHDLAGLVPHLDARLAVRPRFVFPHAPVRPVTINAGMAMRAWYDIDPDRGPEAAAPEIETAARQVLALVEAERERGIALSRLVLGGFSQGGVIALHVALRLLGSPPAGVLALSTYLHDDGLADALSLATTELPIFMAHGRDDPMIPIARAAQARVRLAGLGFPVEWRDYPMGHEICLEEIEDLARWLDARLPAP